MLLEGVMGITKYGIDTVVYISVVCLAIFLVVFFFIHNPIPKTIVIVFVVVVFLFTLNFFRDPERKIPHLDGSVLSPADGTIVLIKQINEQEYFHGPAIQVSIFMSPLDVHVNRYPMDGTIDYFRYIPGDYLVAMEEKSSDRNERTQIGINNGKYRILFKQIAGFIARRIVCPVKEGDKASAGECFGMIKFGSRVDVILPVSAIVKVTLNQSVTAGETILAMVE